MGPLRLRLGAAGLVLVVLTTTGSGWAAPGKAAKAAATPPAAKRGKPPAKKKPRSAAPAPSPGGSSGAGAVAPASSPPSAAAGTASSVSPSPVASPSPAASSSPVASSSPPASSEAPPPAPVGASDANGSVGGDANGDDRRLPVAPPAPAPSPEGPGRTFYGWQILLANGASLAVTSVAWQQESVPLGAAGLAGQAFGAPIVHAAHGRWGASFASFGINALVPLAGAAVGVAIAAAQVGKDVQATVDNANPQDLEAIEAAADRVYRTAKTEPFVGYVTGVVVATAVDTLLQGWSPGKDPPADGRAVARWAPRVEAGPTRPVVGVGGTF